MTSPVGRPVFFGRSKTEFIRAQRACHVDHSFSRIVSHMSLFASLRAPSRTNSRAWERMILGAVAGEGVAGRGRSLLCKKYELAYLCGSQCEHRTLLPVTL